MISLEIILQIIFLLRHYFSCVAEEAAKKAASSALANMMERDLLTKPLSDFTPVVLRYALPWDDFLSHAFAATFGRAATLPPPSVDVSAPIPPSIMRDNGAFPHPLISHSNISPPFQSGILKSDPDNLRSTEAISASQEVFSDSDRAVLGASFLRSPPNLVKAIAASSIIDSRTANQYMSSTAIASKMVNDTGAPMSADLASSAQGTHVFSNSDVRHGQSDQGIDHPATQKLAELVHERAILRRIKVNILRLYL